MSRNYPGALPEGCLSGAHHVYPRLMNSGFMEGGERSLFVFFRVSSQRGDVKMRCFDNAAGRDETKMVSGLKSICT